MPETDETATPTATELQAELDKLRGQLEQARGDARWRRLATVLAPVVTLLVAVGGWAFHGSLQERNRAEIRRDVLRIYFGTDNATAGKRKQILEFVDSVLVDDDPVLRDWAHAEMTIVEAHLQQLQTELTELEQRRAALGAKLADDPAADRQELRDELQQTKRRIQRINLDAHDDPLGGL